mgnify:CR=1 FL=1
MQGIESLGYEIKDQPLVPDGGVQQFKGAADLLAEFGRNGDTYVVHAAEGETVLPMEVLESSPKLKSMIYAQMEELGLQPERYVVGNELNSLNPVTGQPEFFFKKLFKKIKKVGKKVISLAKKVAPIILPMALPFLLPLAPLFLTAGLGSLAGNLIAGNDFKTSLKNAVLAGGMAGAGSALQAGSFGGFTASPESMGLPSIKDVFGQSPALSSTASGPVSGFDVFGEGLSKAPVTNSFFADVFGLDTSTSTGTGTGIANNQLAGPIAAGTEVGQASARTGTGFGDMRAGGDNLSGFEASMAPAEQVTLGKTLNPTVGAPDFVTASGGNPASLGRELGQPMLPNELNTTYNPDMSNAQVGRIDPNAPPNPSFLDDPIQGLKDLYGNYLSPSRPGLGEDPGMLSKYGPLLAVGGAGILAADALFPPEEQERLKLGGGKTGQDLLKEDISSGRYEYGFDPNTFYGANPYYQRGQFTRARQGGQIDGPGSGTSDSIPAMLSDGEFVMTAKAVRGAGGDDRQAGAKRMYAMMRQFENEAAA